MFHLALMTYLHASLALAYPSAATPSSGATPSPSVPAVLFLRGVSIEMPTQRAFEHREYAWVDWGACTQLLARYASDKSFSHTFQSMKQSEDYKRAGDRAACMTAAVIRRFPYLNAVRVPIEPGVVMRSQKPMKPGDDGVFRIEGRAFKLDERYVQALIEPILQVVKNENDLRSRSEGMEKIWVILDWHYIADGNGLGQSGNPWMFEQVAEPTKQFWTMVGSAEWMAPYDNIIFEIFNEPVLNEEDGVPSKAEVDEWSKGLGDIVRGLRESPYGKDRPIATPAPRWSGRCQTGLVNEGDGLYQVEHRYTDHGTLQPCKWPEAPTRPFLVSEVGGKHNNRRPPDQVDEVSTLLNQYQDRNAYGHSIGGWVAWVYGSSNHLPSLLDPGKKKGRYSLLDAPLSPSGQAVKCALSHPLPPPSPASGPSSAQGQPVGLQPAAEP